MSKSTTKTVKSNTKTPPPVKKNPKKGVGRITVDIVTGKEIVSVYFDPEKVLDCSNLGEDWINENLYTPACVLKTG